MSDFEKVYGDVLIAPEESAVISLESVVAALTEVALEVKAGDEVILVDKDGAIFRKQDDGAFHLKPKHDYVIMRRTCPTEALELRKIPVLSNFGKSQFTTPAMAFIYLIILHFCMESTYTNSV
jgi:hypothetical protein